jgi:hypothetical protein
MPNEAVAPLEAAIESTEGNVAPTEAAVALLPTEAAVKPTEASLTLAHVFTHAVACRTIKQVF